MSTDLTEMRRHALTYHGFMLGVKWFCICLATVMTALILWFGTSAGFFRGLAGAAVVFAAGVFAMRHGLSHSTENDTGELVPGLTSEDLERGEVPPPHHDGRH